MRKVEFLKKANVLITERLNDGWLVYPTNQSNSDYVYFVDLVKDGEFIRVGVRKDNGHDWCSNLGLPGGYYMSYTILTVVVENLVNDKWTLRTERDSMPIYSKEYYIVDGDNMFSSAEYDGWIVDNKEDVISALAKRFERYDDIKVSTIKNLTPSEKLIDTLIKRDGFKTSTAKHLTVTRQRTYSDSEEYLVNRLSASGNVMATYRVKLGKIA